MTGVYPVYLYRMAEQKEEEEEKKRRRMESVGIRDTAHPLLCMPRYGCARLHLSEWLPELSLDQYLGYPANKKQTDVLRDMLARNDRKELAKNLLRSLRPTNHAEIAKFRLFAYRWMRFVELGARNCGGDGVEEETSEVWKAFADDTILQHLRRPEVDWLWIDLALDVPTYTRFGVPTASAGKWALVTEGAIPYLYPQQGYFFLEEAFQNMLSCGCTARLFYVNMRQSYVGLDAMETAQTMAPARTASVLQWQLRVYPAFDAAYPPAVGLLSRDLPLFPEDVSSFSTVQIGAQALQLPGDCRDIAGIVGLFKCSICLLPMTVLDPPCYFVHLSDRQRAVPLCVNRFHRGCLVKVIETIRADEDSDDDLCCPGCRSSCVEIAGAGGSFDNLILEDLALKQVAEHVRYLQCAACLKNMGGSEYFTSLELRGHELVRCLFQECAACKCTHAMVNFAACTQNLRAQLAALPVCALCNCHHADPENLGLAACRRALVLQLTG